MSYFTERRLITLKEVEQATSLKKSTIYAMMQRGEFPKAVTIASRRVAWDAEKVQAWIAARIGEAV